MDDDQVLLDILTLHARIFSGVRYTFTNACVDRVVSRYMSNRIVPEEIVRFKKCKFVDARAFRTLMEGISTKRHGPEREGYPFSRGLVEDIWFYETSTPPHFLEILASCFGGARGGSRPRLEHLSLDFGTDPLAAGWAHREVEEAFRMIGGVVQEGLRVTIHPDMDLGPILAGLKQADRPPRLVLHFFPDRATPMAIPLYKLLVHKNRNHRVLSLNLKAETGTWRSLARAFSAWFLEAPDTMGNGADMTTAQQVEELTAAIQASSLTRLCLRINAATPIEQALPLVDIIFAAMINPSCHIRSLSISAADEQRVSMQSHLARYLPAMPNLEILTMSRTLATAQLKEAIQANMSLVEWQNEPGDLVCIVVASEMNFFNAIFQRNRLFKDARHFCRRFQSLAAVVQKLEEIEADQAEADTSITATYEVVCRALLPHLTAQA
jgi:hypothetical protein